VACQWVFRVVDLVTPCIEAPGSRNPVNGYARATVNGVRDYAHRHAWRAAYGPIPDGLWVLHRCDNPPCVHPEHLFLGTTADNTHDMDAKGRRRSRNIKAEWTHCKRGHEFTPESTMITAEGRRRCRTCHNDRRAKRGAWSTS